MQKNQLYRNNARLLALGKGANVNDGIHFGVNVIIGVGSLFV
jgi:hypothetical protein